MASIRRELRIHRPAEDVWPLISDPGRISEWFPGIVSAEVTYVPQSTVRLDGKEAQQVLRLVEGLEELDDVQHVYANFDIPEQVLEEVAN